MSSRPKERLKDVRRRLKEEFTCRIGCGWSAHGVTFKSPTAIENEDRMVMEWANVNNDAWALLAVFDGERTWLSCCVRAHESRNCCRAIGFCNSALRGATAT